jgi:murein DD-endopeptidase MepM/ murein hydrolase activator NlpD
VSYIAPTLAGWTSQRFGTHPGGFNPAGGHTGEDIACEVGTPLMAMAGGVVAHVGYFTGTYLDNPWWIEPSFAGYVVSVDYGPYVSHYAHCSNSPVEVGQAVRQGQVVAYSGNSGSATTGPHVHWEVMPDGWDLGSPTYGRIDPRTIVNGITAQSTTEPKESTLSAAEVKEIKAAIASSEKRLRDHINAVLIGGYTWHGVKHYGIGPVLEETQRRLSLDDADGVNK